jgi:hypothetical protein
MIDGANRPASKLGETGPPQPEKKKKTKNEGKNKPHN